MGFKAASLLPLAMLLAACNGGGGGGGGGGGVPDWAEGGVTFNPTAEAAILSNTEFLNVDADFTPVGPPQANPYVLANVQKALGAGITGAGQMVAVVDEGFRSIHQEFDGKFVTGYGYWRFDDHGTHVASLIAAEDDGVGMQGVAPGASLHFTSYNEYPNYTDPGWFSLANIAAGTLDAATYGAVAQNNSWGFEVLATTFAAFKDTNPGGMAADLAAGLGGAQGDWQDYLDALDAFQETGVIVWAVSNTLADVDVSAALPTFQTSLAEAWIAVVNGYFEVNSNGRINYAELLSAPCGMAASYCIAADGTTWAASAVSNSSYDTGTGTSYAAPQVAGTVALVAQAFPDLSPEEITDRILASANNAWFSGEGGTIDGTVNFGGGITHGYSDIWGHGVLDIGAALSPIGTASIVSGNSLATGSRTPIYTAGISVSGAFGDALVRGLADQNITVFDHFNGNFTVAAGDLVTSRGDGGLYRATDIVRVGAGDLDPGAGPGGMSGSGLVTAAYRGDALASATVLGLSRNADFVSGGRDGWSTFAYAGGQQATENAMAGIGVSRTFDAAGGSFTVGVSQSVEQGALLGLVGNEAFDFGRGTSITAGHLGYEKSFGERFAVFANVEVGIANAFGLPSDGLVRSIGPVGFNGFSLGASARGILADSDRLTVTVSRPLTVASGAMELGMPVGRTIDGTITTEAVTLSLAPGGQQLDLGVNYEIGIGATSTLRFAATYSLDAGNVDGARGLALAAGLGVGF